MAEGRRTASPIRRQVPALVLRPFNSASDEDSASGEERSVDAWKAAHSLLSSRSTPAPSSAPVGGRHGQLTGQCPKCLSWKNLTHFADSNAWICGYIDDVGQACGHTWLVNGMQPDVCGHEKHEAVIERHWGHYGMTCIACHKFVPLTPVSKRPHKKKPQLRKRSHISSKMSDIVK